MSKRNGNISPITFIDKVIKKNELGHPFQSVSVGAEVLAAAVNMCAVDQFEQGGCEAMLNTLGARGWKLVGASLNYGIIFFIWE